MEHIEFYAHMNNGIYTHVHVHMYQHEKFNANFNDVVKCINNITSSSRGEERMEEMRERGRGKGEPSCDWRLSVAVVQCNSQLLCIIQHKVMYYNGTLTVLG